MWLKQLNFVLFVICNAQLFLDLHSVLEYDVYAALKDLDCLANL